MATSRTRDPNHNDDPDEDEDEDEDLDFRSLVSEQRRELMAAQTFESDLDLAFRLQLQEALTASLVAQPQPSAAVDLTRHLVVPRREENATRFASLQSEELARVEQEIRDRDQSAFEMRKVREDLSRRIHDQKVASAISRIPDEDWDNWGGNFERTFGEGSSKSVIRIDSEEEEEEYEEDEEEDEDEGDIEALFRVYFKGLVSEEKIGNEKTAVAGIGVAICDPRDNLIFEVKKPLFGTGLNKLAAEAKALIEGLTAALSLELKRVVLYCDNYTFHQFVSGRWPVKQRKIAILVNQVKNLQRKFVYCNSRHVPRNDIKFAFKFAKDAIQSQINRTAESSCSKNLNETCVICMEDTDVTQIFSAKGCLHRYCFSCMKQHVEVKLREAQMPKCPHEGCKTELDVDSCENFLTPKLLELMRQRIKEAATPVTERVYCPNPRCSFLMSKTEVLEYSRKDHIDVNRSGARRCIKCNSLFCVDCKVPWHRNMSCVDYKRLNPNPSLEDAKLKLLASRNLWRQCRKCNLMIELAHGCYHMTCRCGYEFCYNCGAEWKDKKATCTCPLWVEANIWYDGNRDFDEDEEEEEEVDEEYYDSDLDYY